MNTAAFAVYKGVAGYHTRPYIYEGGTRLTPLPDVGKNMFVGWIGVKQIIPIGEVMQAAQANDITRLAMEATTEEELAKKVAVGGFAFKKAME